MYWAYLVHLGYNMWREKNGPVRAARTNASDTVRLDKKMWDDILSFASKSGLNAIVMDLGEAISYESHPEIAAKGAWTTKELKAELKKMRDMGITPIPKLNFSATHDEWLGDYSKCIGSKLYYSVVSDLIDEVCSLFDTPPLFHLGMDEERDSYAPYWGYHITRHGNKWWEDFYFYCDCLERNNVRPWIWSDAVWAHPDEFLRKMPKTVMQCNWYYGDFTNKNDFKEMIRGFTLLENNGYDQIPCGMNQSLLRLVKYCKDAISPNYLKGFLETTWEPTLCDLKYDHFQALDVTRQAKEGFLGNEEMFGGWQGVKEDLK